MLPPGKEYQICNPWSGMDARPLPSFNAYPLRFFSEKSPDRYPHYYFNWDNDGGSFSDRAPAKIRSPSICRVNRELRMECLPLFLHRTNFRAEIATPGQLRSCIEWLDWPRRLGGGHISLFRLSIPGCLKLTFSTQPDRPSLLRI